jgi:hypothetical protein
MLVVDLFFMMANLPLGYWVILGLAVGDRKRGIPIDMGEFPQIKLEVGDDGIG